MATLDNSLVVSLKFQYLLYDFAILFQSIYSRNENMHKATCKGMFIVLFILAKNWKPSEQYIHTVEYCTI